MPGQLWLADVLRAAGLTVVEVDGWRSRSEGGTAAEREASAERFAPVGVVVHETRGSASSTDAAEINVLVNGRVGLSGPIAQLYLSRTGVWHVVAAGLCHHVRTGWGGPFAGLGNSRLLGVEAQHAESESWADKPVQYASYVRGVAAIVRHAGWPPPVGHREHQPGDKPDPEFDMSRFRADVAAVTRGASMILVKLPDDPRVWLSDRISRYHVPNQTALGVVQADLKPLGLLENGGKVKVVASLDGYGHDVAAPALTLSVADREAITAGLAGLVPSAADVAEAVGDRMAAAARAAADVYDSNDTPTA